MKFYELIKHLLNTVDFDIEDEERKAFEKVKEKLNCIFAKHDITEKEFSQLNDILFNDDMGVKETFEEILLYKQANIVNEKTKEGTRSIDADTVLADYLDNLDNEVSGISEEIFEIYFETIDKISYKKLFESLTGISFDAYLKECQEKMN